MNRLSINRARVAIATLVWIPAFAICLYRANARYQACLDEGVPIPGCDRSGEYLLWFLALLCPVTVAIAAWVIDRRDTKKAGE